MKARKGFTLVELLIVIAIVGVLAAMMTLSSTNATASADAAKILNNLRAVRTAAQQFYFDYPDLHSDTKDKWVETKTDGTEAKFRSVMGEYIDVTLNGTTNTNSYALRLYGGTNDDTIATNAEWYVCYSFDVDITAAVKNRLAGQAKTQGLYAPTITGGAIGENVQIKSTPFTATANGIAIRVR